MCQLKLNNMKTELAENSKYTEQKNIDVTLVNAMPNKESRLIIS